MCRPPIEKLFHSSVPGGAAGARGCWRRRGGNLERVADLIVFSHPYLLALLCYLMLYPNLFRMVCNEFADPARVPKLTRNSKIFAAAHEGVGLATFDGSRNAFGRKIILLAAGDRNQSRRHVSAASFLLQKMEGVMKITFQALLGHILSSPPLSLRLSLLLVPGPRLRARKPYLEFSGI